MYVIMLINANNASKQYTRGAMITSETVDFPQKKNHRCLSSLLLLLVILQESVIVYYIYIIYLCTYKRNIYKIITERACPENSHGRKTYRRVIDCYYII